MHASFSLLFSHGSLGCGVTWSEVSPSSPPCPVGSQCKELSLPIWQMDLGLSAHGSPLSLHSVPVSAATPDSSARTTSKLCRSIVGVPSLVLVWCWFPLSTKLAGFFSVLLVRCSSSPASNTQLYRYVSVLKQRKFGFAFINFEIQKIKRSKDQNTKGPSQPHTPREIQYPRYCILVLYCTVVLVRYSASKKIHRTRRELPVLFNS